MSQNTTVSHSGTPNAAAHHDEHAHADPLKEYLIAFTTLLVLTVVTYAISHVDLEAPTGQTWMTAGVAVGIAVIKATVVMALFMHLRHASKLVVLYALSGFVFISILFVVTMADVMHRDAQPSKEPLGPAPVIVAPAGR